MATAEHETKSGILCDCTDCTTTEHIHRTGASKKSPDCAGYFGKGNH